jgi:hypothetical protein
MPVLCFNGSAPLRPTKPWAFSIPGLALLKSQLQYAGILYSNTVFPRVKAMQAAFEHREMHKIRPDSGDPCNLVADLSDTQDLENKLISFAWSEDKIRDSDWSVKNWGTHTLFRAKHPRPTASYEELFHYIFSEPKPKGSYPVVGLTNINDWTVLKGSQIWKDLIRTESTGCVDAPTTLGRVDRNLARRLLARGYLNTYLISLFIAPLPVGELDRLAGLTKRLDRIVPRSN